ncbi:MAG: MmgE/PrpD family protein, partial [Brevibacterium aurantiacum]
HPFGARPFARANYIEKFTTLSEGILTGAEQTRFIDLAENLENLDAKGVAELSFTVDGLEHTGSKGIF